MVESTHRNARVGWGALIPTSKVFNFWRVFYLAPVEAVALAAAHHMSSENHSGARFGAFREY